MQRVAKSLRLHIGLFGRRNVGKSSLLNAIVRQHVAIVSPTPGTTTDPVEKPMELLPLGPVQFIDTAGIDDEGALGELRIGKTRQVFDRTDLAVVVTDADHTGPYEQQLLAELKVRGTPTVVVRNKADMTTEGTKGTQENSSVLRVSARTGEGLHELREALLKAAPADYFAHDSLLSDLGGPGELAVLVVPNDKEAPKGRLIMPQVQAIRDLLDGDAMCMIVKDR